MSQTMFWSVLAVVCIVLEFIVPGAVLGFIGAAAAIVGFAEYMGWVSGWMASFTLFFCSSIFLVLVVRTLFLRFIPGESRVENVSVDEDAIGALVEVIQEITPARRGRIRFRDTSWEAQSEEYLETGDKAVIVARTGPIWIVQSMAKGDQ